MKAGSGRRPFKRPSTRKKSLNWQAVVARTTSMLKRRRPTLRELAMDLGNPKLKSWRYWWRIKNAVKKNNNFACVLMRLIDVAVATNFKKMAKDRLKQLIPNAVAGKICFNVALPHLWCGHASLIFVQLFEYQVLSRLKKNMAVDVRIAQSSPRSIKASLCNENMWCWRLDNKDFECSCDFLCSTLDVSRNKKFGHVIVKAVDAPLMCKLFGADMNYETRPVSSIDSVTRSIVACMKKLGQRMGLPFDFKYVRPFVTGLWYRNRHKFDGVSEFEINRLRFWFHERCVISRLDKGRECITFICPWFYQRCAWRILINPFMTFDYCAVMCEAKYKEFGEKMKYTGTICKASHAFGLAKIWPKASGFNNDGEFTKSKWRPLASYFKHQFKKTLSVSCKAILWLVRQTFPL